MRILRCDIAIVGAGPSGSMAAMVAAEQGAKVILLEEHKQVGLPNHCAEGLSLEAFKDAGLQPTPEIVSQEIKRTRVYVPSGGFVDLSSPDWVGYTINRAVFDRVLCERATDTGAELMTKTRACALIKDGPKVSGVIAKREGEMFRIEAKVVIGADGVASVVRHTAELGRSYPDILVNAQFRLGSLALDEPDVDEIHLGLEVAPGGYAWVFPKSREAANVGLRVRRISKEPAIFYLRRFMSDSRFKAAKILETTGRITPASGVLERIVDDGVMLVGDAAGQIVPFTGEGVHTGIVAGRMAGGVAAKAVEEGDTSVFRLSEYVHQFDEAWGRRIRGSRKTLELIDRLGDRGLNTLAEVLTGEEVHALANGREFYRVMARIAQRSPLKLAKLMTFYITKW